MGIQINGNTNNINAGIGSLSIEDLNELDIVGVATAANFKTGVSNLHNVGLTLSGGQIDVGSNIKIGTAGVVTATSFVGDGSNLTGITQTTINGNTDHYVVTATGTANTLQGESTLLFNNGRLDVTQTTSSSDAKVVIRNSNTPGSGSLRLEFQYGTGNVEGTNRFRFGYVEGYRQGGSNDGGLKFGTKPGNADAPTERLRINPKGQISIRGTTTAFDTTGDLDSLQLYYETDSGQASIGPYSSGGSTHLSFYTNSGGAAATEKLRIDSSGRVLIGTNSTHNTNSYSNNLIIYENGDTGLSILGNNSNSNYASLYLSDTSTPSRAYLEAALGANGNFTIAKNGTGRIRYNVNGSEKFCMTHTGRFGVGDTDPDFAVHIKSNVPAICFEDTDGTHGQAIIEQNGDELKIRQDAGNASSGTGSTILFQVDASTKMRIDGTGYVGINQTSPTHYLDVDGTSLFRGRVFISGSMSMKSTPFGANVTYDTGISVNGGGYGGSILAICSKNYGAGANTQSGVYLLKFNYDGNTTPSQTLIAGSNLATFGQSGSNTLTVHMGASNNMFTAIESSVVNA